MHHWKKWRRYGDALRRPARGPGSAITVNRFVHKTGYVFVRASGHPEAKANGFAPEHRKKWHDRRGPIPTGMIVHHRNGDKTDNRIRNLELLTPALHRRRHAA